MNLLIRGGRVIDPAQGRDEIADIAIVHGHIAARAAPNSPEFDATGLVVAPGFIDMHVHLRLSLIHI